MCEVGIRPLVGHGFYRSDGVCPNPGIVLRIEVVYAPIPFDAEGLFSSVEEELVCTHVPYPVGLRLSEEGVLGVIEDVPCSSIWVELDFGE